MKKIKCEKCLKLKGCNSFSKTAPWCKACWNAVYKFSDKQKCLNCNCYREKTSFIPNAKGCFMCRIGTEKSRLAKKIASREFQRRKRAENLELSNKKKENGKSKTEKNILPRKHVIITNWWLLQAAANSSDLTTDAIIGQFLS